MALRGCIDASTRENGVYSVAVVAFGYDRAVKANTEWEKLLDGRVFHMNDLNARQGDFRGASDEEVDRIMRGAVSIVRRYASYVMATSCDRSLIAHEMPKVAGPKPDNKELLNAFRSVYGLMCHFSMMAIGKRANDIRRGKKRQISYVFEQGDDGQAGFVRFINFLQNNPGREVFLDGYSLSQYKVATKQDMEGIFHSADLVAWEWAKHVENHGNGRPMRKSLEKLSRSAVIQDEPKQGLTLSNGEDIFFRHFETDHLGRAVEFWRATIAAKKPQDVQDAFNRWRGK